MRNNIKKFNFFLVIMICCCFNYKAISNESDNNQFEEITSGTNHYLQFGIGGNGSLLRDYATSPLFYDGLGLNTHTAWLKRSDERERLFEIGFAGIGYQARIPENQLIQPYSTSVLGQFNLRYLQLWKIKNWSNNLYNVKVGGAIQTTQNIRTNFDLGNAGFGIENISNLLASGQVTRDISRTKTKELDLWFFKPILKPLKRDIRFQMNIGILNLNYRPGYAYVYDSEIIGIETDILSWVFANYKWSLNGYRINTELEYITYLPNGNARSWSYVWDIANAPGKYETFQMASHQIRYTYYFHTKKS